MPERGVATIGSLFDCGDTVGTGSSDVFVNGLGIATLGGSFTAGHTLSGHTFYPPAPIASGSGTVFANNLPVAAVGDTHGGHVDSPHGDPPAVHPHGGTIIVGSTDVFL